MNFLFHLRNFCYFIFLVSILIFLHWLLLHFIYPRRTWQECHSKLFSFASTSRVYALSKKKGSSPSITATGRAPLMKKILIFILKLRSSFNLLARVQDKWTRSPKCTKIFHLLQEREQNRQVTEVYEFPDAARITPTQDFVLFFSLNLLRCLWM